MNGAENSQVETPKSNSSLGVRIASAVVLAPVVLGLVWLGGVPFLLLLAVAGPLMVHEWAGLQTGGNSQMANEVGISLAILCFLAGAALGAPDIGIALAMAVVGLTMSFALWRDKPIALPLLGAAYVGLPVLAFAWLRSDFEYGRIALFWLLAVVWATDIFAYFAGRGIGGPKMAPRLSPNKTWAGLAGGVGGAMLAGGLTAVWLGSTVWVLAIVSGVLAVVSQAGDVTESALKRRAGVKDSGALIPGHGGILDRVDGLMFAAVGAALIALVRCTGAEGVLLWP